MLLKLMAATESDADRIADIHMAVFGTNLLLFAQFPTRAIRDQLRDCIAQKAAHDIRDPNIAVKVVRDQDQVISFAKWSLPVAASETHVEAPWIWPEGSNLLVLDEWTEKAELAKQRILGDTPSYRKLLDLSLQAFVAFHSTFVKKSWRTFMISLALT